MAEKAVAASEKDHQASRIRSRKELYGRMGEIEGILCGNMSSVTETTDRLRDDYLHDFERIVGHDKANYIETIQSLPAEISSKGVMWLDGIVRALCKKVSDIIPALEL